MQRTIEMSIGPDGTVKIEASGFTGGDCIKATEDLEKALGVTSKRDRKKEFYQKGRVKNQNHLKQG